MATVWWSVIDFILPQTHLREEIECDLLSAVLSAGFLREVSLREVIEKRLCYLYKWKKNKFKNRLTPLQLLMNTVKQASARRCVKQRPLLKNWTKTKIVYITVYQQICKKDKGFYFACFLTLSMNPGSFSSMTFA